MAKFKKFLKENDVSFKPPISVAKEAEIAIKWKEEHGDEVDGGTQVGWIRANQLANRKEISLDIIKRMKAFFDRHEKNKSVDPKYKDEPWKDNGKIAWLAWGGDSGRKWVEEILNKLGE